MTRLGVLGWPVAHSRSPVMQQAALRALGLDDWRYQRLPVPPEHLAETVRALPLAGLVGANVTIPHKEAALAVADDATPTAAAVGAANTLTFRDDGTIDAENTDAGGLLDALDRPLAGRSALVLGAGGSARAAVFALREAGAEVRVWNRTPARAGALVADLGGAVADTAGALAAADVLVHCTAAGLDPAADPWAGLPLGPGDVARFGVVADLVYGAGETALVAAARAAGRDVVDGLEVLVRQGARSLARWTGREPDLAVMRDAARRG